MILSYVWAGLITLSLFFSVFTHTTAFLAKAALDGASSAISLSISLAGPLCLWSGLAVVMEQAGLSDKLARLTSPVLSRLFPRAFSDPESRRFISGNFCANLLGLGNAATPLGVSALIRMQKLSGSSLATDEMCRMVVLNTASIQLIPSTLAAVRAGLGTADPFDILPAVWLTSSASVCVGLLAAFALQRVWSHG